MYNIISYFGGVQVARGPSSYAVPINQLIHSISVGSLMDSEGSPLSPSECLAHHTMPARYQAWQESSVRLHQICPGRHLGHKASLRYARRYKHHERVERGIVDHRLVPL